MPSSTSSSEPAATGYGRTLASVLVTLILVAAAASIRPHIPGSATDTGREPERFWKDKILAPGHYRIVVAGDSRVYRGVAPEELARTSGVPVGRVLNFGFSANAYNQEYMERIDSLFAPSGRRILVVAVTPGSLTPHSMVKNGFLTWEARYGALRHDWFARLHHWIENPLLDVAESPWFAPITEDTVRRWLKPAGKRRKVYQHFTTTGWVAARGEPVDLEFYHPWFKKKFVDNQVSAEAIAALTRWVAATRARGISVYGLRMPMGASLRAIEDRESGMDWAQFVAAFEAAGGTWLAVSGDAYETYDGSHLRADEARRLSADLGRMLAGQP